jgi:membrane protein DedA with SNARE-associated domain
VIDWATDVIEQIGLAGVALLVALESVFPPIPSELVLLLTGFNVNEGRFSLVGAIVLATIGSVVGALLLYGFGAWISEDRLERFLATVGRFIGLTRGDIDRGFRWFERHGPWVVFFGRLIPLVRSVVSIPAGADRMPIIRFTTLTAAGSLIWNTIWIVVGRQLGDQWQKAERWGDRIEMALIAAMVVGLVYLVVRARRRRRAGIDDSESPDNETPATASPQ